MSVDSINGLFKPIAPVKTAEVAPTQGTQAMKSPGQGDKNMFAEALEKALGEVNDLQNEADKQIEGLAMKKDGVTPHGAMVALEKADIAFQLMSAIRGKIIRAYEEVIRTQV
jgi:flagellar hook-basal body complex protein FliE